jgi:hypothetical protein
MESVRAETTAAARPFAGSARSGGVFGGAGGFAVVQVPAFFGRFTARTFPLGPPPQ